MIWSTTSGKWFVSLWHHSESDVATTTLGSLNRSRNKHVTFIQTKCSTKCIQLSSLFTLFTVSDRQSSHFRPKSQLKFTLPVWRNVWKLSLTPTVFLSMVHCSNIFGQSDLFAAIDFNSDDDWAFPGLFPKWAFRMKFFFKRLQIFRLPFNFQRARNKLCLWRCVVKFNESISLWWCIHNSWCWCWFWLEILPCALFVQNKFLSFWRRFFLMIKFSFSNKPWSQMYPFESKQHVDSFFLWIDVREQP